MERRPLELGDLVEHWTLVGVERGLVAAKKYDSQLGFGRTAIRHRAEIRAHFGFRECTVADADDLAGWLAGGYAQEERRYELVRDARRGFFPGVADPRRLGR